MCSSKCLIRLLTSFSVFPTFPSFPLRGVLEEDNLSLFACFQTGFFE